jgi:PA14 domain
MKNVFIFGVLFVMMFGCGKDPYRVDTQTIAGPPGPPGAVGPTGAQGPAAPTATPTPTPTPAPLAAGLSCNLYDLSITQPSALPSFNTGTTQVVVNGQVSAGPIVATFPMLGMINFPTSQTMLAGSGSTLTTWYALDCTGVFTVPTTQQYNLTLNSDDGSQLLVDGVSVVDDDGVHSATSKSGSVILESGQHSIELQYFQGPGNVELELLSNVDMVFSH